MPLINHTKPDEAKPGGFESLGGGCQERKVGSSLVVQGLRLCLPMQGVRVPALSRELRSLWPQGFGFWPKKPKHKTKTIL